MNIEHLRENGIDIAVVSGDETDRISSAAATVPTSLQYTGA